MYDIVCVLGFSFIPVGFFVAFVATGEPLAFLLTLATPWIFIALLGRR